MRYAVVVCNNGNFDVKSEWTDDKQGAIMDFHERCKVLWGAPDVKRAVLKILDEDLNTVEKYSELIFHPEEIPE